MCILVCSCFAWQIFGASWGGAGVSPAEWCTTESAKDVSRNPPRDPLRGPQHDSPCTLLWFCGPVCACLRTLYLCPLYRGARKYWKFFGEIVELLELPWGGWGSGKRISGTLVKGRSKVLTLFGASPEQNFERFWRKSVEIRAGNRASSRPL